MTAPAHTARRRPRTAQEILTARGIRKARHARALNVVAAAALFGNYTNNGRGRRTRDGSWLSRVENGHRTPPPPGVTAEAFDVTVTWLLEPCTHCGYEPPAGYTCNTCGSSRSLREELTCGTVATATQ